MAGDEREREHQQEKAEERQDDKAEDCAPGAFTAHVAIVRTRTVATANVLAPSRFIVVSRNEWRGLTFDMRGGQQQAKPDVGRPRWKG